MAARTLIAALAASLLLAPLHASAQTESWASMVSTLYYGPYALPVPELLEGRIHRGLEAELSGDVVKGRIAGKDNADWTYAPTFRLSIPLWTDRATFSLWGEFHEFYHDNPAVREARNVEPDILPLKGNDSGNLYFSIEMQLLKEGRYRPSVAARATTLSATGDDHEAARHYDAPGYFFDLSAGKSFRVGENGSLRVSGSAGFVCWQIGEGTQNDAWLLGAKLSYSCRRACFSVEYGQYKGREKDFSLAHGVDNGDFPQALKSRLELHFGDFSPFIMLQYGLQDWPFTQLRAGVCWYFDLLGRFRQAD